ncbi:DUF2577 domain-containing protein [Brevibacillus sp. DP1.3A]|uniref:DUF2577 domain-containing protein n=1 Tax=Brevibacillus sp. DP1.3A TaxID=2738867 RepID=UPI001D16F182|nr:DUF2577 domain-containing protein [Brevibacillus sp. DP1.3A]UED78108.1 DUF2577 domain-containing protein [Brevibacillus sp. DP1.3A]
MDLLAEMIVNMYKENRNPPSTAPRVGTVVSVNPLKIQYGESVILERRHLVIGESLMPGYKRTIELTELQMSGLDEKYPAKISFYRSSGDIQERITKLAIPITDNPDSQENKIKSTITYTDGLEVGDQVILQPDESLKLWFVKDRVWKEPDE